MPGVCERLKALLRQVKSKQLHACAQHAEKLEPRLRTIGEAGRRTASLSLR